MRSSFVPRLAALVLAIGALALVPAISRGADARGAASGESVYLGCPSPAGAPRGFDLWIHVQKWCAFSAVRGQQQIKLQVSVKNTSSKPLSLALTHIRLLMVHFDVRHWSPPSIGSTYDRPFLTTFEGSRVWAVPANGERAYDPLPGHTGVGTFATHWSGTTLDPGETFRPIDHERGDVVFYVPHHGGHRLHDVVGLAYVDGSDVIVCCPPSRWRGHTPAGNF